METWEGVENVKNIKGRIEAGVLNGEEIERFHWKWANELTPILGLYVTLRFH